MRHALITCDFKEKDAAEFLKIKGLQYITVKGVLNVPNQALATCTLVNVEPPANYPVKYVERIVALPGPIVNSPTPKIHKDLDTIHEFEDPNRGWILTLLIEAHENGNLSLNHDETGDLLDITPLIEKLKTIFQEREKNGTPEREIVIDPHGRINPTLLNILIESLVEDAKATSILVIK